MSIEIGTVSKRQGVYHKVKNKGSWGEIPESLYMDLYIWWRDRGGNFSKFLFYLIFIYFYCKLTIEVKIKKIVIR